MGKKRFLIGGVAVAAAAAALYGGLVIYPEARFRAALGVAEHSLPHGISLHYKSATYSLFSDRGALTGVTLHSTGPLQLDLTVARVELVRPSLNLAKDWQQAERNPGGLRPATTIPVADALQFTGVTIRTRDLSEKVAHAHIKELHLYPWALLHPGVPAVTEAMTMLARQPQSGLPSAILPLLRFGAAMVLGTGNSDGGADGVTATISVPATPGLPARNVTYHIRDTTVAPSERGIFGAGTATHIMIALGPPAGTVTIRKLTVDGLNVRNPASRLLAASTLSPGLLSGLAMGRFHLAGVAIKRPSQPPIALGTFTLSRLAVFDGLPVSAALSWDGIRLTRAEMPTPQARLAFTRLGLDAVTISFDAAYNWELDANRIALQDLRLNIPELGSLGLSASLVGVAPGPDALEEARLAHAVLRYEDASLCARALRAASAFTNTSPQTFRQQMITRLRNAANEFTDSPTIAEAAKAVAAFLQAPHSLTIALSPAHPLGLAALQNAATMPPPALASLLGLSVIASQ